MKKLNLNENESILLPEKEGFVRIPRSLMPTQNSISVLEYSKSRLLLVLLMNVYFSPGFVEIGGNHYLCQRGEWVVNIPKLSMLAGIKRGSMHNLLLQLKAEGKIDYKRIKYGCHIAILNYDQLVGYSPKPKEKKQPKPEDNFKESTKKPVGRSMKRDDAAQDEPA